jgi:tripartite-type tricarboxylate transporter receptor subunit TctC
LQDFTDIALFVEQPNVMVRSRLGPLQGRSRTSSMRRRRSRASLNIGHAGIGSGTHLNTERVHRRRRHPGRGSAIQGTPEVVAAILSATWDGYWAPISAALSFVKGGKVRPARREHREAQTDMPDVPTAAEAGVKGLGILAMGGALGTRGHEP